MWEWGQKSKILHEYEEKKCGGGVMAGQKDKKKLFPSPDVMDHVSYT